MKNFLGAILAALLDLWLPLFITLVLVLGVMKMAQAAEPLPRTLAGTGYTITILEGQFSCKPGWNRALRQSESEGPLTGCAMIDGDTDEIDILWDTGTQMVVPPDWRWYPEVDDDSPDHDKDTPVREPFMDFHPRELKS